MTVRHSASANSSIGAGWPNVPALFAGTAGYDLIEEIGVDSIRENSVRQTRLLIDLLDEAGFEVGSPRDARRRGGTVTVRTPEFEAVHKELAERQKLKINFVYGSDHNESFSQLASGKADASVRLLHVDAAHAGHRR